MNYRVVQCRDLARAGQPADWAWKYAESKRVGPMQPVQIAEYRSYKTSTDYNFIVNNIFKTKHGMWIISWWLASTADYTVRELGGFWKYYRREFCWGDRLRQQLHHWITFAVSKIVGQQYGPRWVVSNTLIQNELVQAGPV